MELWIFLFFLFETFDGRSSTGYIRSNKECEMLQSAIERKNDSLENQTLKADYRGKGGRH